MAAKKTTAKQPATPVSKAIPATEVARTEVRNSPVPKAAPAKSIAQTAAKKEITHEMIQFRAYEIWQREGGNEYDNWCRAERELRSL